MNDRDLGQINTKEYDMNMDVKDTRKHEEVIYQYEEFSYIG